MELCYVIIVLDYEAGTQNSKHLFTTKIVKSSAHEIKFWTREISTKARSSFLFEMINIPIRNNWLPVSWLFTENLLCKPYFVLTAGIITFKSLIIPYANREFNVKSITQVYKNEKNMQNSKPFSFKSRNI